MPSKQLFRYVIVGGISYCIEISVLYFFKYGIHLSSIASVAISFWVGLIAAFILQKLVAFQNGDRAKKALTRQLGSYAVLAAWNYIFTLGLVSVLSPHISVLIVRTLAIAIITCWNFAIYRSIFKTRVLSKEQKANEAIRRRQRTQRNRAFKKKFLEYKESLVSLKSHYVLLSLIVLAVTSVLWSLLSAQIQLQNTDQLIEGSLFSNLSTFHAALLPSAHTFFLKWPLFFIAGAYGNSSSSIVFLTVLLSLVTVSGLVYILYRIDRRPRVFGTLVLALSGVLLLIPAQPHLAALLPVNFAMLSTRNIEYLVYILGLVLVIRTKHTKSILFLGSLLALTVLFMSDKLFESLALGSSALVFVVYLILRRRPFSVLALRLFFVSILSALLATVILKVLSLTHVTHIVGSTSNPYGFISSTKQLGLGAVFAVLGVLTNLGINPAYDVGTIKTIPGVFVKRLMGPQILAYLLSFSVFVMGIVALIRVYMLSLVKPKKPRWNAKKAPEPYSQSVALSILLIASTISAGGVFIVTSHYYPVDSRYLTIVLFTLFIALATYLRSIKLTRIIGSWQLGALLLVAIGMGCVWTMNTARDQAHAYASVQSRNEKIAEALRNHKASILVGDYWRVAPIAQIDTEKEDSIVPLGDCTTPRASLTRTDWNNGWKKHSFVYLLSLEASSTDYPQCSIKQVVQAFGHPNASTLIEGTNENPKELLLYYSAGIRPGKPQPVGSTFATILPSTPAQIVRTPVCTDDKTIMNIVAHEDDDLLFMNPDLLHEIAVGNCIRTVYVTAGDAGHGNLYWLGREQGSQAAYDTMLNLPQDTIWVQKTIKLENGEYATVTNPVHNHQISLIFMRLSDGNLTGSGFTTSHYESLAKLHAGDIASMHSVDKQSSYTAAQLTSALTQLMDAYTPTVVHTQAPRDYGTTYNDHSDHITVGQFTSAAFDSYTHKDTTSLSFYIGYPTRERAANVSSNDLSIKTTAFLAYGKFDGGVCQSIALCDATPTYDAYLRRQYTTE